MPKIINTSYLLWLGIILVAFSLSEAYLLEYLFFAIPCPICILQRIIVALIGIVFLFNYFHRNKGQTAAIIYCFINLIFTLIGSLLACRQIWIEQQALHNIQTCQADLVRILELYSAFDAMQILFNSNNCGENPFSLFNISLPIWTLLLFIILGLLTMIIFYLQKKKKRV